MNLNQQKNKVQSKAFGILSNFVFEHGDYILHPKYGVGRFHGMEFINLPFNSGDFAKIEYQNATYIYVPVFNLNMLKFHSAKDSATQIEAIGHSKVLKRRVKLKGEILKIAHELAKVAALRKTMQVDAYDMPDNYAFFDKEFGFELTASQKKAELEIIADLHDTTRQIEAKIMPKIIPMDRLICADVGFGKTELALRAAFIAMMNCKKVLFIVPTTILAQQHYELCVERFAKFPIKCGLNSRIHNKDLASWHSGKIDILISTASNVGIKNLLTDNIGLVILDEEQHFGVKFKEQLRTLGHFLQISATPIPRTLNLALANIKDISTLDLPPFKKKDADIKIIFEDDEHDKFDLQSILSQEIAQNGSVFLIVPRINYINEIAKRLENFEFEFTILHSKLDNALLEQNLSDFKTGKKKIIIGTNIIESGIHIPHANLMIIFYPHLFGISQLYQLRGRVGRADDLGRIYLVTNHLLKNIAHDRLNALVEHNFIGANMQLAMHDLSTRGAGSVLGVNQSGNDYGLGVETYYEMLADAIFEINNTLPDKLDDFDVQFDGFNAFIPQKFIPQEAIRLSFYKKLSVVQNQEQLLELAANLKYFGMEYQGDHYLSVSDVKLPLEIKNLLFLIEIKCLIYEFCKAYKCFFEKNDTLENLQNKEFSQEKFARGNFVYKQPIKRVLKKGADKNINSKNIGSLVFTFDKSLDKNLYSYFKIMNNSIEIEYGIETEYNLVQIRNFLNQLIMFY